MTDEKPIRKTVQSDEEPSEFSTPGGRESAYSDSTKQMLRDANRLNALGNSFEASDPRRVQAVEAYNELRRSADERVRLETVTAEIPAPYDSNNLPPVVRVKPRSESP